LRLVRDGETVKHHNVFGTFGHNEPPDFDRRAFKDSQVVLTAEDEIVKLALEGNATWQVEYYVGGGGGHALTIKQLAVRALPGWNDVMVHYGGVAANGIKLKLQLLSKTVEEEVPAETTPEQLVQSLQAQGHQCVRLRDHSRRILSSASAGALAEEPLATLLQAAPAEPDLGSPDTVTEALLGQYMTEAGFDGAAAATHLADAGWGDRARGLEGLETEEQVREFVLAAVQGNTGTGTGTGTA